MTATDPSKPTGALLDRVLLPIASVDDAAATGAVALPHVAPGGSALGVYVVEKAGGAPDKAGVEQREAHAEEAFAVLEEEAEAVGVSFESRITYGTDIVEAVLEVAREWEATVIAFRPRGGSWLVDLITGDISEAFVNRADRPVLVFPRGEAQA
ncbi:MAG: universal stress protein [Halobacteriaceae archaeon]